MVEPGQTLDKYELIEKVGQGGMAVVYRGVDTSLKRQVAVKVLHHHLADHQEARDRFEREAQAVAKLRHENILEIFDYSGVASAESYIVTEFIDGETLKEFISTRALGFAELGAMIAAQVCRALAHAHSFGILHRDVKPENIMIRSDGVIKLMDFGIAQMLDTQRLTVTGQLLGSPAYMSPEHVEGKRLDFRTDVFSVGILLYQLVTGELPFRGRNAHEILKRIADCEYPPPNEVEPRTGSELSKIIAKAMAREQADRYADVTQMLTALESYLRTCDLSEPAKELARFFAAPSSYEIALGERLVAALTEAGRSALADDRVAALEYFNRVLMIDPDNAEVLAEIDKMSKRARGLRVAALAGAVALLGAGGFALTSQLGADTVPAPTMTAPTDAGIVATADATAAIAVPPAARDAAVVAVADAAAAPAPAKLTRKAPVKTATGARIARSAPPDAGSAVAGARAVTLLVKPHQWTTSDGSVQRSEYRVDDGPWRKVSGSEVSVPLQPGAHVVEARNRACCNPAQKPVSANDRPGQLGISLPKRPGSVVVVCKRRGVRVTVDGQSHRPGANVAVLFSNATRTNKVVDVTFLGPNNTIDAQSVSVRPNQTKTVKCAF